MARKKQTVKIDNSISLVRDVESRAVVNTDVDSYHAFMNRRQREKAQKEELNNLKSRIEQLEKLVTSLVK